MNPERLVRLVREHLDRDAAGVNAAALLRRIRRAPVPARRFRGRAALLAAAAGILLALLLGDPTPAQAGPAPVLRQAQAALAREADRCYLEEVAPEPAWRDRWPFTVVPPRAQLWARGDRYWVRSDEPQRPGTWGRDEQGRLWLVVGPRTGLRFDRQELPRPLAVAVEIRSLDLGTLLGDVLRECHLRWEAPAGPAAPQRIRADWERPNRPLGFRRAVLEVDPATKVIRRLELWRTFLGQPVAKFTYTLRATGPQPDDAYRLEGHLEAPAQVLDRRQPLRRSQLLFQALGRMPAEGI